MSEKLNPPAPAAVADKGGQDECSGDHPCDHFAWCDKHRPNLPPGPDLSHEYARELDTPPAAAQCICRECDTPRPIQGGASNAILTGKSLEIEQPCATCGRITWSKPFNVDALRGLPPAPAPAASELRDFVGVRMPAERPTPVADSFRHYWTSHYGKITAKDMKRMAVEIMADLERQLAEAREGILRNGRFVTITADQFDALREQRDRLAEALERVVGFPTCARARSLAVAALDAVKGGTP